MDLVLGYLAGLLTLINPCVLPVLPIVIASALQASRFGPVALAAGMSLSFVGLGLLVAVAGRSLGLTETTIQTGGALLMIGLYQLTPAAELGQEGMALKLLNQLPDFRTPMLVLIGASSALLTPENLVFYLKEAGLLLVNQPGVSRDLELTGVFVLVASSLLLLPPLAWIATGGGIRDPLLRVEGWLVHRAEWVVGVLALLISAYLAWEGLHGLWLLRSAALL
jgi:cytochrome c biogenesis protein CcdA